MGCCLADVIRKNGVIIRCSGKVGTPKRDAFESSVDEAVYSYKLGEAIKKARLEQNLTQEELGERIGVKKAQNMRSGPLFLKGVLFFCFFSFVA